MGEEDQGNEEGKPGSFAKSEAQVSKTRRGRAQRERTWQGEIAKEAEAALDGGGTTAGTLPGLISEPIASY